MTGAPGLHEALVGNGFEPDEPESIMIGEARLLDVEVPLPEGVEAAPGQRGSRRPSDVRDAGRTSSAIPSPTHGADALLRRLARDDGMELWVAEAGGQIVSAGRLEPVAGSEFAGIWGGATLEEWRGRGIYRALTAARARSALAPRQDAHAQRLHRVLPADPRTLRPGQGLDDHALPLAARPIGRAADRTVIRRRQLSCR